VSPGPTLRNLVLTICVLISELSGRDYLKIGCVQKPNKPKPKEPFIKENDVTFCIYYLHPEHKSIHHTKRQHFLTDTQKLKDTLQSSPQHSATT
jgi:hypothetical protein